MLTKEHQVGGPSPAATLPPPPRHAGLILRRSGRPHIIRLLLCSLFRPGAAGAALASEGSLSALSSSRPLLLPPQPAIAAASHCIAPLVDRLPRAAGPGARQAVERMVQP